jgi:prepilin-type N-terminal cleavage/methylation domain-containing protein
MKSNGFTLIEILVALFILGFALLALAGLMVTTTKNNSFGGHMHFPCPERLQGAGNVYGNQAFLLATAGMRHPAFALVGEKGRP